MTQINMDMTTAEAMALIERMTPEQKAELDSMLTSDAPLWVPQPGPQTMAYYSQADIIFYGGAAGGGKTALLMGLSLTAHF